MHIHHTCPCKQQCVSRVWRKPFGVVRRCWLLWHPRLVAAGGHAHTLVDLGTAVETFRSLLAYLSNSHFLRLDTNVRVDRVTAARVKHLPGKSHIFIHYFIYYSGVNVLIFRISCAARQVGIMRVSLDALKQLGAAASATEFVSRADGQRVKAALDAIASDHTPPPHRQSLAQQGCSAALVAALARGLTLYVTETRSASATAQDPPNQHNSNCGSSSSGGTTASSTCAVSHEQLDLLEAASLLATARSMWQGHFGAQPAEQAKIAAAVLNAGEAHSTAYGCCFLSENACGSSGHCMRCGNLVPSHGALSLKNAVHRRLARCMCALWNASFG